MTKQRAQKWAGQKEKTERALTAYLELLDAAEYLRSRVYGQLATYDLTMRGFRVLELLHRRGPTAAITVARTLGWSRQNLEAIVKGLTENGWVRARRATIGQLESLGVDIPEGDGRPVSLLVLTKDGTAFAKRFLPRHAKVVKAYMRALDGRQQQTLAELCRKIRKGDAKRFISELEHEDVEE
jgi:predicted ArsR family transcriptional regulator